MSDVRALRSFEVSRKIAGSDWYIHIEWILDEEGEIWEARRQMPGVNQYADLPQLNTSDMLQIFRWMRDISTGAVDKKLISPSR